MNAYKFYKLTITETYRNGGTTAQTFANLSEVSLYNADGADVAEASGCKYSASSSHSTGPVSGAFDNTTSTFWHSDWNNDVKKEHWIQVELPEAAIVSSLGLNTRINTGGYDDVPGSFYLSASNDGKTWAIVLEQRKLSTGWSPGVERVFRITNTNRYFYENRLLPEIPADLLEAYPYCWIRQQNSINTYQLMAAAQPWYYKSNNIYAPSGKILLYTVQIANTATGEWVYDNEFANSIPVSSTLPCVWSNHDIPNGSASATDIYYYATEPVPENSGDQIMEYLQSTGLQYIDTGAFANPEYTVELSFRVTHATTNWDTVFGTRTNSKSRFTARFSNATDGVLGFQYSNSGTGTATLINTEYTKSMCRNEFRVIRAEKNQWYVDGTLVHTFDAPADSTQYPSRLFLFANNDGGSPGDYAYIRIAYCKIWNNGALIRDYVPMWRNGVACMWDTVTDEVYVSEGSAPFFAGALMGPPAETKYLIRSEGTLYTVVEDVLTALDESELSALVFQTHGTELVPDSTFLVGLTNPEVLCWIDSEDRLPELTATVTGSPKVPQVIVTDVYSTTDESILGISSVEANMTDDVLICIAFNDGVWKYYNGTDWVDSDGTTGMHPTAMEAVTAEQWAEIFEKGTYRLRFAIPNTTAAITSIVVNYVNL